MPDYVVLSVVAAVCIGSGLFLLSQAKNYRARHIGEKLYPQAH